MALLNKILNWRLRTPFFYGWLILGIMALGSIGATSVAGIVLGGIQDFILDETKWNRTTIGLAGAMGVWGSGLVAPVVGRLADRYGPRWIVPIGTIILSLCLWGLGGAHTIWQFYLAAVVGRAISQPILIGVIPRTLAVNFFRRRRNVALALTGMFRPVSGALIIQFVSIVAVAYSWRTAFKLIGVLSLALTLPLLIIVRRRPEDIGLAPDGVPVRRAAPASEAAATARVDEPSWTAGEALRTRAFWLLGFAIILAYMGGTALAFNMVSYLTEEAHLTRTQAAGVLSLSTFLALGNLGWGFLADKFTPQGCFVAAMLLSTAILLYLFRVDSLLAAYLFSIGWGLASGASDVLVSMVLAQYYGRNSFGAI
ncbi:MAG: MFS transporter, partial [Dehalococcoidia bacterium]